MFARIVRAGLSALLLLFFALLAFADDIPKAAWKRPIGQPLENGGTKKTTLGGGHIGDGYGQGGRVGGDGRCCFYRRARGEVLRLDYRRRICRHRQRVDER